MYPQTGMSLTSSIESRSGKIVFVPDLFWFGYKDLDVAIGYFFRSNITFTVLMLLDSIKDIYQINRLGEGWRNSSEYKFRFVLVQLLSVCFVISIVMCHHIRIYKYELSKIVSCSYATKH